MENKINKFLEELIQEIENDLDEATTSGAAGAYSTPNAFSDNGSKDKKKKKKIATQLGMKLVGKVNEFNSSINKRRAGAELKQKLKGKRSDGMGKYTATIYGLDSKGKRFELKSSNDLNKYSKFEIDESVVQEAMSSSQIRSAISKVKKQLMRKWKQKGGYENFGQKELDKMKSKFDYNPYGSSDERQISKMLDGFDNWAMNYDGNMRESSNESVNEGKYNYKADALTAYFKGKIDAKELDKIARDDFKSGIATKKELSNFLSNKFTQDVMSDTYGIPTGTLIKRVRGLMKFAESIGESVVTESKVKRPINRWLELKNDESMHPHKKMAMGLKELKHQLAETQKFFNWYNKIKTMNELDSNQYWKRTNKHIYKIKERLINIAKTIQEIEK